jgi:hypothetical protein
MGCALVVATGSVAHVKALLVLAAQPLAIEDVAARDLHIRDGGFGRVEVKFHFSGELLAAGHAVKDGARVIGLRLHPVLDLRRLQIFKPTVWVYDGLTIISVRYRPDRSGGRLLYLSTRLPGQQRDKKKSGRCAAWK